MVHYRLRLRALRLVGATVCRILGHKWSTRKWQGAICGRCKTFAYYGEGPTL